jgi:hypothetical protein
MRTLTEHIVKSGKGYSLKSHTGKNLGTYPTKAGAEHREKQVNWFKSHPHEEKQLDEFPFGIAEDEPSWDLVPKEKEAPKPSIPGDKDTEKEDTDFPAIAANPSDQLGAQSAGFPHESTNRKIQKESHMKTFKQHTLTEAFTRQHYIAIAKIIADARQAKSHTGVDIGDGIDEACDTIAVALANMFAIDNPAFDKGRFLTAAGV